MAQIDKVRNIPNDVPVDMTPPEPLEEKIRRIANEELDKRLIV